jgi:hypothetical protein
MRSETERNLLTLIRDMEIQTDNAVRKLDNGTRIDIKELKATIDELLDTMMDYHDRYQVIMNTREIIEE